jgi:cleavage stimulation factor subunit 3
MSESPVNPSAILHTTELLTDIEGDLANAAIVVAAPSENAESDAHDTLLDQADAVENTLEQSIPPAPESDLEAIFPSTQEAKTETAELDAACPSDANDSTALSSPSRAVPIKAPGIQPELAQATTSLAPLPIAIATEASSSQPELAQAAMADLTVINAEINEPILPESVAPAGHDVPMETKVEEETSSIVIDVMPSLSVQSPSQEPTIADGDKAPSTSSELEQSAQTMDTITNLAANIFAPSADASASVPSLAVPAQTSLHDFSTSTAVVTESSEPDLSDGTLPPGLTSSSPSVLHNKDLVKQWRSCKEVLLGEIQH